MTDLPRMTLRKAALFFGLACLAVMLIVPSVFVLLRGDRFTDSTLSYAASFRTTAAADSLARTLERDWRDLHVLARRVPDLSGGPLTQLLNGASGDGSRISWMGYADLDGTVLAATDDLLLEQDVGQRPWFRGALSGGFAGDVHEAVLLANLLENDSSEPLRFIDLALPVMDRNGDPAGVLGMHINAAWLTAELRQLSRVYELEFYLLNPAGEVSASAGRDIIAAGGQQILRAASVGVETGRRDSGSDGRDYFWSLVPQVAYGDLPNFGWRMAGRLEADRLNFGVDLMRNGAAYAVAAMVAAIAILTYLFVQVIVAPVARLAASAERISQGSDEYPANSRLTRETAQLSLALARLQQDRITEGR